MVQRSLKVPRSCGCLTAPIALMLLINVVADAGGFDSGELVLGTIIIGLCLYGFGARGAGPATRAPLVLTAGIVVTGSLLTLLSYKGHIIPCGVLVYLLFFEILHRSAVHDGAGKAARYMRSLQVLIFLLPLIFLVERFVPSTHRKMMTVAIGATWLLMLGVYALLSIRDWSKLWEPSPAGQRGQADHERDPQGF